MTNPNITDIVVVQDRSGSMVNIQRDAEGGINSFIKDQINGPGELFVSFVEFDTEIDTLYLRRRGPAFESYRLNPRGGTSLLDAIGQTVNRLGELYASINESDRPGRVYFVINTDGEENSSREFTKAAINELITRQRNIYNWEFVFLAANQDAIQTGGQLGFAQASTMTYTASPLGAAGVYASASAGVMNSRSTGTSVNFTEEQRQAALDLEN